MDWSQSGKRVVSTLYAATFPNPEKHLSHLLPSPKSLSRYQDSSLIPIARVINLHVTKEAIDCPSDFFYRTIKDPPSAARMYCYISNQTSLDDSRTISSFFIIVKAAKVSATGINYE